MFNFEKLDVWQEAIGFAAEKPELLVKSGRVRIVRAQSQAIERMSRLEVSSRPVGRIECVTTVAVAYKISGACNEANLRRDETILKQKPANRTNVQRALY